MVARNTRMGFRPLDITRDTTRPATRISRSITMVADQADNNPGRAPFRGAGIVPVVRSTPERAASDDFSDEVARMISDLPDSEEARLAQARREVEQLLAGPISPRPRSTGEAPSTGVANQEATAPVVSAGPFSRKANATTDLTDSFADRPLGARILDQLESYGVPGFGSLRVSVAAGVVTLGGQVPTVYEKRLVLQIVGRVAGVANVVDRMKLKPVERQPWRPFARFFPQDDRYTYELPFNRRHVAAVAAVAAVILAFVSFGRGHEDRLPVHATEGRVYVGEEPADGALLVFHPVDGGIPRTVRPMARADAQGKFVIGTYDRGDGSPAGAYRVTIEWRSLVENGGELQPGPNRLPPVLAKPETTTLRATIKEGANELPPFKL